MTASVLTAVASQQDSLDLHDRLLELVRPEFRPAVIMVATGDPVMGFRECKVDGCVRPGPNKDMCTAHYQRWMFEGQPDLDGWVPTTNPGIRGRTQLRMCLVGGCRRGVTSAGLCAAHRLVWVKVDRPPIADWCLTVPPANDGKPDCGVEDCTLLAESAEPGLCRVHGERWRNAGKPPFDEFSDRQLTMGQLRFDFRGIRPGIQLELQYALQCKVDERKGKATPVLFTPLLNELRSTTATSLLERSADDWLAGMGRLTNAYCSFKALVRFTIRCLQDVRDGSGWDSEYPRDVWELRRLNMARAHGNIAGQIRFTEIPQPWLRDLAKRYTRMRLSAGLCVSSVQLGRNAIVSLAVFVEERCPGSRSAAILTRELLEGWLARTAQQMSSVASRKGYLSGLRGFLTAVRRHCWAPSLPSSAALHPEDFPRKTAMGSRFLSEFVMAQLEDEANLARMPQGHYELITRVIIGTGLRQGDARQLAFDCLIRDPVGAPYLRYTNHKMKREAVVPIDHKLADLIVGQQQRVRTEFPQPTILFPRPSANLDGLLPLGQVSLNGMMTKWLLDCDVRDETGRPAHVTPHQFRHTYATRLINRNVPLEVVRRLLDHSSMQMTAHYARLTDHTVREQWEKARKVDIRGQEVVVDGQSPLGDAAWMKHNLGRAKMALPNGYCGLPLQQTCPHANACLDCAVFITTPEFLGQHKQQLVTTEQLISRAKADGHFRMVEMNERVATNLQRIVTALERPEGETDAS